MSRYKVVRELGRNQEGGRITYLATDTSLDPPVQVVIKEFRFALASTNWSAFKAYEREIEVLRELNHPRIPRYLDSFETKSGFCLVQEYKNALSLAVRRSFTPEDIKKIAVSVLEILVDLQKRTPPIIHRDIKPENILVDKSLNAYLVDFGFARIRGQEIALSSVAMGTPGFMPPEEQFGRTLTSSSDLYSLGATLICLLTGTRSVDVSNLMDDNYRFDFKKLVPTLNPCFISWLEKMVAPNVKQRHPSASDSLKALKQIQVLRSATWIENLVGTVTHRKQCAVLGLGLATLVIAGMSANLMGANLMGAHLKGATMPKGHDNFDKTNAIELGGLYLTEYCRDKYGEDKIAIVKSRDPYSWRCFGRNNLNFGNTMSGVNRAVAPTATIEPIDMGSACAWQYGQNRKVFALLANPKDMYSWQCFINKKDL